MNRKKASLLNILLLSVLFIVCIVHCCYDVVNKNVKVYSLHVVVTLFAATNNTPTSSSTPTINNNNNTPPPKAGSPGSGGGANNLTELKPVQPTMSQSYTPLPSFSGQFSSKHALLFFSFFGL